MAGVPKPHVGAQPGIKIVVRCCKDSLPFCVHWKDRRICKVYTVYTMIRPWFDHDPNVSQKFAKWSWLLPIVADFRQWSRLAPFGSSLVNQTDAMSCESSVYTTARDKLSNISNHHSISLLSTPGYSLQKMLDDWWRSPAYTTNCCSLRLEPRPPESPWSPTRARASATMVRQWRDMTGQCSREVINIHGPACMMRYEWYEYMNRIESICVIMIDASDHGTRPFCERRFQCPAQVARGAKQSGEGPGMREWEHAMAAASPSRKDKDSCERFQSSTYAAGSITCQHCRHYSIHFKTSLYIKHGFKRFK